MRVTIVTCVVLLASLSVSHAQTGSPPRRAQATSKAADETNTLPPAAAKPELLAAEEAIRQSARAFVEAFDRGDARAVADLWTSDGDYADESGRLIRGREAIAQQYAAFFAQNPGAKIKIAIDSIRLLDAGTAIEDGSSTLTAAKGPASSSRYTAVHVNRGGKWLLASVREMRAESSAGDARLHELDWLIGAWQSEGDGPKVEVTCRWIANRKFVEVTHLVHLRDHVEETAREIIGWDPMHEDIKSWMFHSDGGYAVGSWTSRERGWTIEFSGVAADGTRTSAVNILVRLDGAMVWKSVLRSANDAAVADTEEIVLHRK